MQILKIITAVACLFILGCNRPPEKTIVGHWQVYRPEDPQGNRRQIHLYLNADKSLRMEIHSSRREPDVHYGTYELAREGKLLIVHREGNKDKTNEAEIIELKARSLILVDHSNSPSGDTMWLKRVD